jgi:hypothetical protein
MAYWEAPKVEWIDLLGSEIYTVALLHFSMTSRASGERLSQHVTEVTRFNSDGKMTEMRIHYFDAGEVSRIDGPNMKSI